MKRINIKCPYCGSQAFLRPASVVFPEGAAHSDTQFFVCARYPACDAYVSAHAGSLLPMGTLADARLRRERQQAHRALGRLWQSGLMNKKEAYRWLQTHLGLSAEDAHIGRFSEYRCGEIIRLCKGFMDHAVKRGVPRKGGGKNESISAVERRTARAC